MPLIPKHRKLVISARAVQQQESLNSTKGTITLNRRQKTATNYARIMGTTRNEQNEEVDDENLQDKPTADAKKNPHNAGSWSSRRCHLTVRDLQICWVAQWLPTPRTVTDLMSSLTDQEYERYTSLLPTMSQEIEDAVQSIQEMSMRILIRWA